MENPFKFGKSAFAFVLAVALIVTSMFTGGAVFDVKTKAASVHGYVDMLEFGDYLIEMGSSSKYYDSNLADYGETGTEYDPIIIDSAEELVYLCKASGNDTAGKYYKVDDGIDGFNLANDMLDLDGTLEDNLAIIQASGRNHAGNTPGFQGHFDGNGVTVYGAWASHTSVSSYAGLFSCTKGDVTIKNINVKFASFTATKAAGGIVGYHSADDMATVTIENCSVTDSHLEVTGTGYGTGIGAIIGYGASAPAKMESRDGVDYNGDGDTNDTIYTNVAYNVKNCFVNLDENYFTSFGEDGIEESGERVCHGGIAGAFNSNAFKASDCIVLGITPYATTEATTYNDVQHSGIEYHFTNIYTNMPSGKVTIGGTTSLGARDYTGKIFELTADQMKGAAAVDNMNLDWSVWMADDEGYPELSVSHRNTVAYDNFDGTHKVYCECGFGGSAFEHIFVDGACECGAWLNCASRKTIYWDGSIAAGISNGSGTQEDPYIIKSAAEFAWLIKQKADVTAGKYFRIDDAIGAIVLQPNEYAEDIMKLENAAAVKEYFETNAANMKAWLNVGWEQSSFAGSFDGNGVTVYGLYQVSSNNAGLFSTIDAGAVIKNIALKNSYLTSTAGNYQVGGIAAVTSSSGYGIKTNGIIWFDSCVVANNYLYNSSDSHDRSGVIIGASSDVVYMDNCLVYGNNATYGNGVKMPVWSSANNGLAVSSSVVLPDGLETVDDGAEISRYFNMVRNSIIFDALPYDLAQNIGSRFNDPKCYQNVLTDADIANDVFANGSSFGVTDEQIKSIKYDDLATIRLSDAFVNTDTYPELKVFHDFDYALFDNGDGTHSAVCSCGAGEGFFAEHSYIDGYCVCGAFATYCEHNNTTSYREYEFPPTCTDYGYYNYVTYCNECNMIISDEFVELEPLGHDLTFVSSTTLPSTCTVQGCCIETYYCYICGESFDEITYLELDADAHTYYDDNDVYCDDCGYERFTYGDVNNDGKINNRDLALLMQWLNGWNVTISDKAADVDGDGKINNRDYALLMQYVIGDIYQLG